MNFIFISPNFPDSYWLFCKGLKKNGVRVFAIADVPYTSLSKDLTQSIDDYYMVRDMQNYDEMLRGVAYFTHKYGKIDWIESNNEFWLRQDSKLRTDFNVTTGIPYAQIDEYQSKTRMKDFYQKANIKTARYELASTYEHACAFIKSVGYPIVIKPNVGVGASNTYKIKNQEDLVNFFHKPLDQLMIMEEFVDGECFSFDGICNRKKEILFVTSHQYTESIMDAVNEQKTVGCYSYINIPKDVLEIGTRAVQAFSTNSRFFHFEFFRLTKDQPIGKKGEILGLEVNMRPPGGFLPDMINYANDCNVFQLWADMIVYDTIQQQPKRKYSSGFIGRRNSIVYLHSIQEIEEVYKQAILMVETLPKALAAAMGDQVIVARFKSEKELLEFFDFTQAIQEHTIM